MEPKPRLILDTLIFHTFILMNIFNAINCRVVEAEDINIFRTILNNPLFWIITLIEVSAQCGMLFIGSWNGLGSILLGTTGLTAVQQITAWVIGASVLPVNLLIKKVIPLSLINSLPLPKFEDPKAMKDNIVSKMNQKIKD